PDHYRLDSPSSERRSIPAARGGRGASAQSVGVRVRRHPHPVPGHQARRYAPGRPGLGLRGVMTMWAQSRAAIVMLVVLTVVTGVIYPLVIPGSRRSPFRARPT